MARSVLGPDAERTHPPDPFVRRGSSWSRQSIVSTPIARQGAPAKASSRASPARTSRRVPGDRRRSRVTIVAVDDGYRPMRVLFCAVGGVAQPPVSDQDAPPRPDVGAGESICRLLAGRSVDGPVDGHTWVGLVAAVGPRPDRHLEVTTKRRVNVGGSLDDGSQVARRRDACPLGLRRRRAGLADRFRPQQRAGR